MTYEDLSTEARTVLDELFDDIGEGESLTETLRSAHDALEDGEYLAKRFPRVSEEAIEEAYGFIEALLFKKAA